jgi:hypothetical protein
MDNLCVNAINIPVRSFSLPLEVCNLHPLPTFFENNNFEFTAPRDVGPCRFADKLLQWLVPKARNLDTVLTLSNLEPYAKLLPAQRERRL